MNRIAIFALVVIFAVLVTELDAKGKKKTTPKPDDDEDEDGDDEEEGTVAQARDKFGFLEFDNNQQASDLGRKTCTNDKEITHCSEICQNDNECKSAKQDMACEDDCLLLCKFIDDNMGSKCVLHMMSRISWYRNPATGDSAKMTRSFQSENLKENKAAKGGKEEKPEVKATPPPAPAANKKPGLPGVL